MSEPEEDFAAMLEASFQAKKVEKGEMVEGVIVAIGPETALVDVGGKGEAVIHVDELKNAEGEVEAAVGDRIQAMVVSTSGGVTLSRKLAGAAAGDRQIEDAFHSGLPAEGRVEKQVKGGYEVFLGRQRTFCPASQIDLRGADAVAYEGNVYQFRIIEYKDGGRNIVVSRRALLEEEQQANAAVLREKIVPDAVLTGRVASIRDFGAFIDLGAGIQGLLHVSEMSWSRSLKPSEIVKPGGEITVKVLAVDQEKGKISLGLKQLSADPWLKAGDTCKEGGRVPGRVTRVAEFGAFVEIEPGIEALAHASTFAPSGSGRWSSRVTPGMTGTFQILSVDLDQKRIGVALVEDDLKPADQAAEVRTGIVPGARLVGKVERHEKFGVFVFLAPGRTGLIPLAETGVAKESDLQKTFPVGSDVEVIVLDVDPAGHRIRLSAKAVTEAREAEEMRRWSVSQAPASEGFGTLADKLRSALKPKDNK
ncbi:MAG TPA: S1 RNA-binding domain-containing protein [Acidobacteriota bacterium]|nr:S1 RNA-binding domain-containing protein [Acidobacteriota bacterium]